MFADAERVDADVLGEDRLSHDVAEGLSLGPWPAVRVERDVAERVETEVKRGSHQSKISIGGAGEADVGRRRGG